MEYETFPKAIIFDWDDTLVDNWLSIHNALNNTLIAMDKKPWPLEKTKSNVRLSMREQFPLLFGKQAKEAGRIFMKYLRTNHLEHLHVLGNVRETLEILHQMGIYLGIASNKNGNILREQVNHLKWNDWFSSVVGANDANRDKPSRDPIDMVLNNSGIKNGRDVWFVGDAPSDMECAHNAGVLGVLVTSTSFREIEFSNFPPQVILENTSDLINLIKEKR